MTELSHITVFDRGFFFQTQWIRTLNTHESSVVPWRTGHWSVVSCFTVRHELLQHCSSPLYCITKTKNLTYLHQPSCLQHLLEFNLKHRGSTNQTLSATCPASSSTTISRSTNANISHLLQYFKSWINSPLSLTKPCWLNSFFLLIDEFYHKKSC